MSTKNSNKQPQADNEKHSGDSPESTDITGTYSMIAPQKTECDSKNLIACESAVEGDSKYPTIRSLGRLEEDLARLQQSWTDVEQQLEAKDSEIAYLNDEREVHIAAFKSLQTDLDDQLDEHDRLQDVIAGLEARIVDAQDSLQNHEQIVAGRDADIQMLKDAAIEASNEFSALQAQHTALTADLKARTAELKQAADIRQGLERRCADIRTDMQGLESYIDRRKAEWDGLHAQLDDYRAAIAGMQSELDKRDQQIAAHDQVQSGLEKKIDGLRQRCAELDGRRAERELANKELNELLGEKSSEIEFLRKERDDAREGSHAMVSRIQDQQARIDSLEHEVNELGCRLKGIREAADSDVAETRKQAREEVESIGQRLEGAEAEALRHAQACEVAEKRLADLETELGRRDEAFGLLRDANTLLEGRLIDESNRLSQITEELGASRSAEARLKAEYEAFQGNSEQRLEANSELIAKLEAELETRNAAIDMLEKNADKLGAINDDIQKLDRRIIKGVQTSEKRLSTMTGRNLTLAIDGMPGIKFPIYKPCMTIGRSSESDIQLRRKFISRCHARLTEDEGGVRIEDLGSKNGLFVNHAPTTDSYLKNGDLVDIGEVQLRYVDEDQAA